MKKEVFVNQVSDDETNYNLEMEEQIEEWYKKESKFKAVALSISVFILIAVSIYTVVSLLIPNVSLEDIRIENLKKANSYVGVNKNNLLQAEKMVEIYEKRISDWIWCINWNMEKGKVVECRIFNNK